MKKIMYLMIASSFLAAQVFTIDLGAFQLSIYRTSLILLVLLFFLNSLANPNKVKLIANKDTKNFVRFYFIWLIYAAFTIAWVVDYQSWFMSMYFIGNGFLAVLLLPHFVKERKTFIKVFSIMNVMIAMHNLIGWYELFTMDYKFADLDRFNPYNIWEWDFSARVPISMMGNPNDYALLMVFGVFIAYICFVNATSVKWRLFSVATTASCMVLCFLTDSRANILGLLIGIALFLILYYSKNNLMKPFLILLIIIFGVVFYPGLIENILGFISSKLQFNFGVASGSVVTRLNLIKNGLVFLYETAGFGTGAGNIEYWMSNYSKYHVGGITNIHNWWLEILVGYGVFIFVYYMVTYVKLFGKLYSAYNRTSDKFARSTSLGLLCFMAAFLIASISSSSNISKEWLWVFWGVAIAFVGHLGDYNKNSKED